MRQLPSADIRSQDYKVGARMIPLGLDQASSDIPIDKSAQNWSWFLMLTERV